MSLCSWLKSLEYFTMKKRDRKKLKTRDELPSFAIFTRLPIYPSQQQTLELPLSLSFFVSLCSVYSFYLSLFPTVFLLLCLTHYLLSFLSFFHLFCSVILYFFLSRAFSLPLVMFNTLSFQLFFFLPFVMFSTFFLSLFYSFPLVLFKTLSLSLSLNLPLYYSLFLTFFLMGLFHTLSVNTISLSLVTD